MTSVNQDDRHRWGFVIAAALFTGLGLAVGFYAAGDAGGAAAETGAEHAAAADAELEFSATALRNMGVELGELQSRDWRHTTSIVATIESEPLAERALYAPIGGRVLSTPAATLGVGATVPPGTPLLTLVREPIPLPELDITAEAVHPMHAELHEALRNLVQSLEERRIASDELARLRAVSADGEPLVPRERLIELEYSARRARVTAEQADHELRLHGLSPAQIEQLVAHVLDDGAHESPAEHEADGAHPEATAAAADGHLALDAETVRRALRHRGQWPAAAARLDATIPAPWRELPLVAGTVGELAASGLVDDALLEWFENDPRAAAAVLRIGALLLSGRSVADVRALHESGALRGTVTIEAPDGDIREGDVREGDAHAGYELRDLAVRPGALVQAGAELARLRDLSNVRLVAEPIGGELGAVLAAIEGGTPLRATPLLPGTGPELEIDGLTQATDRADGSRVIAWARVANRVLSRRELPAGGVVRTWALRPGTRYRLRVPVRELQRVFVLPRSAVTESGADRVVLLPDEHGDVFTEVPVVVAAEDDEVVVLRPADQDPRLADGKRIVLDGAFEIGLALHAGDQDTGHGHDH